MSIRSKHFRSKLKVQVPSIMWHGFDVNGKLDTLAYFLQMRGIKKKPVIFDCDKKN